MKYLLQTMLLGASLTAVVGILPLAATTVETSDAPTEVDAVTCATPPATPVKKESTSKKEKKEKKKKTSKQKKQKSKEGKVSLEF